VRTVTPRRMGARNGIVGVLEGVIEDTGSRCTFVCDGPINGNYAHPTDGGYQLIASTIVH